MFFFIYGGQNILHLKWGCVVCLFMSKLHPLSLPLLYMNNERYTYYLNPYTKCVCCFLIGKLRENLLQSFSRVGEFFFWQSYHKNKIMVRMDTILDTYIFYVISFIVR